LHDDTFTSAWAVEVAQLIQAHVGQDVVLAFIANTPGTFNLGPDQIIFLCHLGGTSETISAMLEHDQQISAGLLPVTSTSVPLTAAGVKAPSGTGASAPEVTTQLPPSTAALLVRKLASIFHSTPVPAETEALPVGHSPTISDSIVVRNNAPEPDWAALLDPANEPPEQPDSLYRVRLPYAVKLTDPIIVFRHRGYYY
jgi:hypothetical protein